MIYKFAHVFYKHIYMIISYNLPRDIPPDISPTNTALLRPLRIVKRAKFPTCFSCLSFPLKVSYVQEERAQTNTQPIDQQTQASSSMPAFTFLPSL